MLGVAPFCVCVSVSLGSVGLNVWLGAALMVSMVRPRRRRVRVGREIGGVGGSEGCEDRGATLCNEIFRFFDRCTKTKKKK